MKTLRYLANLGYGSRRDVATLIGEGRATSRAGRTLQADDEIGRAVDHYDILIDGEPLDPAPGVVIAMHKPVGYVCSTKGADRLVYELLPARFAQRSPVLAPVGRLDRDTSGLLLLTDDGQRNHRLTSPRAHLPKTYEAELANGLQGDEPAIFASGTMMLDGETTPLRPAMLEMLDSHRARVTLTEGRYHQVRRMFAAVGNHVEHLHRAAIGDLAIGDLTLGILPAGAWRVLLPQDLERLG